MPSRVERKRPTLKFLLLEGFSGCRSLGLSADFILSHYQLVLCSQEQQHCFCFTVKAFFNGHLVCRGRHPGADKARTVLEANAQKQKSGFPIMAIKAMLSAINIFSPRDREEKNAPLTDTAC